MGVAMLTIVTLLDEQNRLPGRSRDATSTLWDFLIRQIEGFLDDKLGTPVVVRSADLWRFARPLLSLSRPHRPVVRTKPPAGSGVKGTGPAGLTDTFLVRRYEDVEGFSPEWQDVISGYQYLESGIMSGGPFSLWIIGAADLCKEAIEHIPTPKRMFALQVKGTWSGMPWAIPEAIPVLLESSWSPQFTHPLDQRGFLESGMRGVYKVIGRASDPPRNNSEPETRKPRGRLLKYLCCGCCRRNKGFEEVSIVAIDSRYICPRQTKRIDSATDDN
ncbi:virion protein US2 [Falconid herpesvirus 1]|uniref:Virion protein US2 n=2 Tax=Columbid alphaherpesvirus 1 TaxID=93386 RepID=A0A068EPE8_9ALPH|nr:virion protein US2 [Falconid herpesvirus 1]YP_009353000.1 virion protein US2 [Columbid alphaherpesvirus 1]AID52796.1 virion protein US2 [Falconid herpesvirus 1]ARD71417.1 virion protein US2 [Columbid alphaherpesvirus 1]